MKPAIIPADLKGKALFDFLVKNEALIFHAKKSEIKRADSVFTSNWFVDDKGNITSKSEDDAPVISTDATKLKLDVVINTTNWFDSHYDVHIPGLWDKSLKDNKATGFYLLNSHKATFENVIGEGMRGRAVKMGWKDLGYEGYTGVTEALMFGGVISKDRNEYMFGQYAKRYVKQHSVGMQYVKIVTCINDDDYPVQKENWDKYFPMVANAKDAEEAGFFWAVLEAKVREGSAVVFGSNAMTPTYATEEYTSDKHATEAQPQHSTVVQPVKEWSLLDAIQNINL